MDKNYTNEQDLRKQPNNYSQPLQQEQKAGKTQTSQCENHHKQKCTCESSENNIKAECKECANETCENFYDELEKKVKEYIGTAQQVQADFDNYRKKTAVQILDAKLDGQIEAIKKILPVLDSFAGAKKMITDEKLLEGFLLVETQMISALKSLGVEKIGALGEEFNPHLHNALATASDEKLANNFIKEEYQAGYKLGDKIIRYSQVIVNKRED